MVEVMSMKAREILDSRGFPTMEVDVVLEDGAFGRASVPSGKSTGSKEAVEWRDRERSRFEHKGLLGAIEHIHSRVLPSVKHKSFHSQAAFDMHLINLDGSQDKHVLGANTILACSIAFARALAMSQDKSLVEYLADVFGVNREKFPTPMMNVINGGKHADSGISTQEFMLVPHGAPDVFEAIRMGVETYHALSHLLERKGYRVAVGDEGGFAPRLESTEQALSLLQQAIEDAGFMPGDEVSLALDFAANDFYDNGTYHFEGHSWTSEDMTEYCLKIARDFPVVSIEDGLAEDDWNGWKNHTAQLTEAGIQCVGDDIFVTNPGIFREGIEDGVANAILIKPNQIGTLSETFDTMHLALSARYNMVISHRSGETDDPFISDLAVATGAGQMKSGAPARGERVAKYNQLIRLYGQYPDLSFAKNAHKI